jgi:uncharacterized membrane protein (DUF373 family)
VPDRTATADDAAPAENRVRRTTDRLLRFAEDVVYVGACIILAAGALALLSKGGWDLVTGLGEGTGGEGVTATATSMLDTLLLVFVLVELLAAVRVTLSERQLLAEPFLLVGVIATIKEIVVTSTMAKDKAGTREFDDLAIEVGVLSALLLVLAVALFLLRRKEREPEETD